MNPPPLPTNATNPAPPRPKSYRIRDGKLHWLFAIPGTLLTLVALTLIFDTNGSERGIETSLGLLILIIAAFFLTAAFIARLLRPYHCANCQTKLHRRALSCSNCHAEFI
jgi:hypothetical protein